MPPLPSGWSVRQRLLAIVHAVEQHAGDDAAERGVDLEDVVVAAWKIAPANFAMRRYNLPSTMRVLSKMYGTSNLLGLNWVAVVEQGRVRVTPKGRRVLEGLRAAATHAAKKADEPTPSAARNRPVRTPRGRGSAPPPGPLPITARPAKGPLEFTPDELAALASMAAVMRADVRSPVGRTAREVGRLAGSFWFRVRGGDLSVRIQTTTAWMLVLEAGFDTASAAVDRALAGSSRQSLVSYHRRLVRSLGPLAVSGVANLEEPPQSR